MVDRLAQDYAGQNVLFLEDTLDTLNGNLYGHWWQAGPTDETIYLPMVMVDNGYQISFGYEEFYIHYKQMVDSALARSAKAELSLAWYASSGDAEIKISLRNTSGVDLKAANNAHLHLLAYAEEPPVMDGVQPHVTRRFVVGGADYPLNLANGAQASLLETLPAISGWSWDELKIVALVDYRPGGSVGPNDSLQAALGTRSAEALSLRVMEAGYSLVVSPGSGGYNLPLHISAPDNIEWTARIDPPSAAWLAIAPTGGTGTAVLQVSILSTALAPGDNQAAIIIASPSSQFTPVSVLVKSVQSYFPAVFLPVVYK